MNKTLFIITIILIVIATVVTISFFNIKKKFDFIIDSYKIAFENNIPFLYILLSVNNRSFLSAKIKNVACKLYFFSKTANRKSNIPPSSQEV